MSEQVLVEDLEEGDVIEWSLLGTEMTHHRVARVEKREHEDDGTPYILVSVEGIGMVDDDEREFEPGALVWRCHR